MSLSYWGAIDSTYLNQSTTTLKAFEGCGFKPYKILNSLFMELGVENFSIDVEFVDALIDYNLLLDWSCIYVMTIVASSVFQTLQFPHQGRIVTIDQLNYCRLKIRNHGSNNIPFVDDSKLFYESVGVGLLMDSSLMWNFTFSTLSPPPKVFTANTILTWSQPSPGPYDHGG